MKSLITLLILILALSSNANPSIYPSSDFVGNNMLVQTNGFGVVSDLNADGSINILTNGSPFAVTNIIFTNIFASGIGTNVWINNAPAPMQNIDGAWHFFATNVASQYGIYTNANDPTNFLINAIATDSAWLLDTRTNDNDLSTVLYVGQTGDSPPSSIKIYWTLTDEITPFPLEMSYGSYVTNTVAYAMIKHASNLIYVDPTIQNNAIGSRGGFPFADAGAAASIAQNGDTIILPIGTNLNLGYGGINVTSGVSLLGQGKQTTTLNDIFITNNCSVDGISFFDSEIQGSIISSFITNVTVNNVWIFNPDRFDGLLGIYYFSTFENIHVQAAGDTLQSCWFSSVKYSDFSIIPNTSYPPGQLISGSTNTIMYCTLINTNAGSSQGNSIACLESRSGQDTVWGCTMIHTNGVLAFKGASTTNSFWNDNGTNISSQGFRGSGSGLTNLSDSSLTYRAGVTNIANLALGATVGVIFSSPFPPATIYSVTFGVQSPEATGLTIQSSLLTTNGFTETITGVTTGTFTNSYQAWPYQ